MNGDLYAAARSLGRAALLLLLLLPGVVMAAEVPAAGESAEVPVASESATPPAPVGEGAQAPTAPTAPTAPAPPAPPVDAVQAGTVEALLGAAVAVDATDKERPLQEGAAVYVGELIRTAPEGKVKLRFLDDSVMDVGTDSEVRLTAMVYDPDNAKNSRQALTLLRGLFRFVTGALTAQNPENLSMAAPLATVGIRGTITDHFVDAEDELVDGTRVRVVAGELHSLRESSRQTRVVVTYRDLSVVLDKPDTVADVQPDKAPAARELTSFEKRHFGAVAIEPYSFDPEVGSTLRQGTAAPGSGARQ